MLLMVLVQGVQESQGFSFQLDIHEDIDLSEGMEEIEGMRV